MKKLLIFGLTICFFITTFFNGFSQKDRIGGWLNKKGIDKSIQFEQTFPYSLTVSQRNYTNLENPISISDTIIWDDPEYLIPVGFDFEFMGLTVDTLVVGDNYIGLEYSLVYDEDWNQYYYEVFSGIDVFGADMIDFGFADREAKSHINYELEGTAGNRILKIEWIKAGFYKEVDETGEAESYAYFQVWLFEEDNHFEMRYGPSYINNETLCFDYELGPYIDFGRAEDNYSVIHGYYLEGAPSDPTMTPIETDFDETLNGNPQSGTTYFFTVGEETTIGIKNKAENQEFEIYPNPSNGFFNVKSKDTEQYQIQVFDILGNKLLDQKVKNNSTIDISKAPKGTYIVHALSNNMVLSTQKLIKN
jgi:type IX secretion system substrate protein